MRERERDSDRKESDRETRKARRQGREDDVFLQLSALVGPPVCFQNLHGSSKVSAVRTLVPHGSLRLPKHSFVPELPRQYPNSCKS